MTDEIVWGLPFIIHLFLISLGAGAFAVSAYLILRKQNNSAAFTIARYGALLAPFPIMLDGLVLISELGSFHVGDWFKFLNLYMTITTSPISIGTWLITVFIGLSLVYAYTFLTRSPTPDETHYVDKLRGLRKILAWIGLPLALAVAIYPGFLLSTLASRPLWNSPLIPLIFLISALSLGVAYSLLIAGLRLKLDHDSSHVLLYRKSLSCLNRSGAYLLVTEFILLMLFIFFALYMTTTSMTEAVNVIMPGGQLAPCFWFWAVLIGLIIPALILAVVAPKVAAHCSEAVWKSADIIAPVLILIGAFMLRYVLVVAGQITGPIGL